MEVPAALPAAGASTQAYDPAEQTVADVQAHVEQNPDQRAAVLKAERKGKNRSTLVDWLEAQSG